MRVAGEWYVQSSRELFLEVVANIWTAVEYVRRRRIVIGMVIQSDDPKNAGSVVQKNGRGSYR